ncbi:hypothetical protein PMAYCL1PPCAC_07053, partial [Pristionchus mayeri]
LRQLFIPFLSATFLSSSDYELLRDEMYYLHKPHRITTALISILAAVLPGLGCFILLFYTFLFQQETLAKFTIPGCPNATSVLPPVSYAIGVWEPQRLLWQAIMLFHFPARVLMGYIFYQCFDWQPLKRITGISTAVESLSLLAVSVIHINAHFLIHAFFFGLWLLFFNLNILFQTIMLRKHDILRRKRFRRSFSIKIILFPISVIASLSTAFSYPYATSTCNSTSISFLLPSHSSLNFLVYVIFCISEYLLVAINSFYYSMVVYEFNSEWVEVRVSSHGLKEFSPSQPSSSDLSQSTID